MIKYKEKCNPRLFEKAELLYSDISSKGIPVIKKSALNELLLELSLKNPKTILEIGTAEGFSGIAMLSLLTNCELVTVEKDEQSYQNAAKNFAQFGFSDRVKQINADAGEALNFLEKTFDFIFLDGAKARYLDYLDDIKRLLNKNGVLFADNVLFRGYIDGGIKYHHRDNTIVRNMREFLDKMIADDSFITSIREIGDGILVAAKIK